MVDALLLCFLFLTKHFIVDFPLQTKYQWSNKGTYGHPGGLLHAFLHVIGTMLVLCFFCSITTVTVTPFKMVVLSLIDGVIHYHIDGLKMRLNEYMGWKPDNSECFWWLLGFDQYLHNLTYLLLIFLTLR